MTWDVSWDGVTRLTDAKIVIAADFIHKNLVQGRTIQAWDRKTDRVVEFFGIKTKRRLATIGRTLNLPPTEDL